MQGYYRLNGQLMGQSRTTASWFLGSLGSPSCLVLLGDPYALRLHWERERESLERRRQRCPYCTHMWKKGKHKCIKLTLDTSAFESLSASLCFMSLAIEKKTSSTFMFVFALCLTINILFKQISLGVIIKHV